jgi:hypothetical protein
LDLVLDLDFFLIKFGFVLVCRVVTVRFNYNWNV